MIIFPKIQFFKPAFVAIFVASISLLLCSCDKEEERAKNNTLNFCDRFTGHPGIEVLVVSKSSEIKTKSLELFAEILREKGFKILKTKDVYGEKTEYQPLPNSNAVFVSEVSQEPGNIGLVVSTLQAVAIVEAPKKRSFLSVWDSVDVFSYGEGGFEERSLDKIKEDFLFLVEQIISCDPDESQRPVFYL